MQFMLLLLLSIIGLSQGYVSNANRKSPEEVRKLIAESDLITTAYVREYRIYKHYGNKTSSFTNLINALQGPVDLKIKDFNLLPQPKSDVLCVLCRMLVQLFIEERRNGASIEQIKQIAFDQCVLLNLQPEVVCRGLIKLNAPIFLHIFDTRLDVTENEVCALFLQSSQCGEIGNFFEFSLNLNTNGIPITESKQASPVSLKPPLKIIHITDIHYDPHYTVGNNAVCGAVVCCREDQGLPSTLEEGAGFWGDYRDCDTPVHAVEDVFARMKAAHPDVDYVYHTGDIVDHGIWATSFDLVETSFNRVHNWFRDTFTGIPTYSVLGNHEAHPTNVFSPSTIVSDQLSTQWLYDLAETQWSQWLPTTTIQSIRNGGFYTVLVRPGFRIIALNNNDCFTYNFWILHNPSHLAFQLQWFHNALLTAEAIGEKVHVLAHIPPGDSACFKIWAREYRRIIDRFWNTIIAQFHGHTHNDEFNVFYSLGTPSYAINQAWNAGSSTAYRNVNPNYHVLTVDSESFEVLDVDSYYYNLTEANLNPDRNPLWQELYSFKRDHGLPDLSPASLDDLVVRMATDKRQISKQWLWAVKLADTAISKGCADDCLLDTLCKIVINQMGDDRRCQELAEIFNLN